jgi:hypothetical protein
MGCDASHDDIAQEEVSLTKVETERAESRHRHTIA